MIGSLELGIMIYISLLRPVSPDSQDMVDIMVKY